LHCTSRCILPGSPIFHSVLSPATRVADRAPPERASHVFLLVFLSVGSFRHFLGSPRSRTGTTRRYILPMLSIPGFVLTISIVSVSDDGSNAAVEPSQEGAILKQMDESVVGLESGRSSLDASVRGRPPRSRSSVGWPPRSGVRPTRQLASRTHSRS